MGNRDLRAKSISELRAMAKKAGIAAKREWGKEDFVKALSKKTPKSKPVKPAPKKPKAKKTAPKKPAAKKAAKPAPKAAKPKPKAAKPKPKAAPKVKAAAKPKPVKKPPLKSASKPALKPAPKPKVKPLDQLTVAELRSLARGLRVPLAGISRKADIIKAINASTAKEKAKPTADARPKKAVRKTASKPRASGVEKTAAQPVPVVPALPALEPDRVEEMPLAGAPFPEPTPLRIEYDGDKVVSMPVTPRRLYVYWEMSEETMAGRQGSFNIKITDIRVNSFFYMPISERIGEYFINVSPEGEYSIEVGFINHKGEFVNLAQLQRPEQPAIPAGESAGEPEKAEKGGLPEEFFETPESVTSY